MQRPSKASGWNEPEWELTPYKEYAASPPFTFYVGPNLEAFTLPADLVAKQSRKLHALVNNGMKESRDKSVKWPEQNREVFFKFGSFVHTGDYSTEDCLRRFDLYRAHVQVYVFADYHGINELQKRSLKHLQNELDTDTIRSATSRDPFDEIAQLVEFVFEEAYDLYDAGHLISLMVDFCAEWSDRLIETRRFQNVLRRQTDGLLVPLIKKLGSMGPLKGMPVTENRDGFRWFVGERADSDGGNDVGW